MAALDTYGVPASAAAVTPSDTTDLTNVTKMVWVGGAGAIAVIMQDGSAVTLSGIAAGTMLPIRVSRIKATGTTATLIVAIW